LFLDEIGDMPLSLQTRLLRVLAEDEFFRVGGRELIRVDVRVIAATHQDLNARVADGRFRADLMHRVDVVRLALPALRERREDIPLLANRFLAEAAAQLKLGPKRFAAPSMSRLQAHDWPGNVRELENLCWRVAALAPGETILPGDLPLLALRAGSTRSDVDWESALRRWADAELANNTEQLHARVTERMEQVLFDAALDATEGHRERAATRLGIGRNTLSRKLGRTRPKR
jgi:two-component system nitrogen regulation response regulator GlnG